MRHRRSTIGREMRSRIHDLHQLWEAYQLEYEDSGVETIFNYGLAFDYVAPGTFGDQREGYFRFQLSWGGPSDEFRFFVNLDHSCHRIEYWFLDWFDGTSITCRDGDESFLLELWELFREVGSVAQALKERVQ
ncbi:hypothetical protein HMPREF9696_02642 [Afipia clevelandensis ATCC 49720]|uniref:Uncharacterized protein n=2 Tax=Afipia clevelandensis TaxID=1034 RepID=K8P6V8_9BRAD|nr:hypothetical protein HMPREF9696_02642 [Afipia clevelandensis ATCC 49720]